MLTMIMYHVIHNINLTNLIRQRPSPCYYRMFYNNFDKCNCTIHCKFQDYNNVTHLYKTITGLDECKKIEEIT